MACAVGRVPGIEPTVGPEHAGYVVAAAAVWVCGISASRMYVLEPLLERIFKQAYQSIHTTFKDALRFRYLGVHSIDDVAVGLLIGLLVSMGWPHQPPARLPFCAGTLLSIAIENPTEGRGGCSRIRSLADGQASRAPAAR